MDYTPETIKEVLEEYQVPYDMIENRIMELTGLKQKLSRCLSGGGSTFLSR